MFTNAVKNNENKTTKKNNKFQQCPSFIWWE